MVLAARTDKTKVVPRRPSRGPTANAGFSGICNSRLRGVCLPFPATLTVIAVMAVSANQPLLVILGPTASGKTDLALPVARGTGAEILSVDSMQVYRGVDVGTAKPTPAERAEVRHHLIDVVGPDEPFTVARFVEQADDVIADARSRGVPLIATRSEERRVGKE